MKLTRTQNTWLLLFALTIMVQRVLLPFSVPPVIVHENGYIEICATDGSFQRLLLDAEGKQVESQQPPAFCPKLLSGHPPLPQALPFTAENLPPALLKAQPQQASLSSLPAVLLPPTRAPPLA